MTVLDTAVSPRSESYRAARKAMVAALVELAGALDSARQGGGERAVTRHHARGKLLARERLELLVDRDSPLLELSPVAGWGTSTPIGAGVVAAIGVVTGRICVLAATDPTVRDGAIGEATLRKLHRAQQIAYQNRLPMVSLIETTGIDQHESHPRTPQISDLLAGYARLNATRLPNIGVLFGGTGDLDGDDLGYAFDQLVTLRPELSQRPPDHLAADERDAVRLARHSLHRLPADLQHTGMAGPQRTGVTGQPTASEPKHDPEDLLAVPASAPREILGRLLDGSQFDESQPGYGPALCTGWGELHGHRVGVVADSGGSAGHEEADKAAWLVERAGLADTPVLLLRNGSASRVEAAITAAAGSGRVPLLAVRIGGRDGPAAISAQARFRFTWPIPGPPELGCSALYGSGQLADDGVIDPRDTRTVLGLCLAVLGCGRR